MPTPDDTYRSLHDRTTAAGATLVAVSKTRPAAEIMRLYALGHRDFGENRVAELTEKQATLPADIRWHFIGHLQRNKVKAIAPFIHLIHAVDSPRLLREIDKQGRAAGRRIPALLQYHVAAEESKYGLDPATPTAVFADLEPTELRGVQLRGVMGMATYTDDTAQIRSEFDRLTAAFQYVKREHFESDPAFCERSMGMSGDWEIALAAGSTLVRVGSLLFG